MGGVLAAGELTLKGRHMKNVSNPFLDDAATEADADILLLNAAMMPGADESIRHVISRRGILRKRVILVLVTSGGLPDVAYRIAMTLRSHYESVAICIPGWCKSAGTLLAISGDALIMGTKGEMGPLDVQIAKRDDLGGDRDSGLVINEALSRLRDESFELFSDFLLRLIAQSSNAVTLRTAADIAAQLTIGLMSPIFEKIDPMRMGADARAMNIGQDYALRLNAKGKNLKGAEALSMLLNGYPSHSFVIDINEARGLFTNVEPLCGKLSEGIIRLGPAAAVPDTTPDVRYLDGEDGETDGQSADASSQQVLNCEDGDESGDDQPAEDIRRDYEDLSGQEGQSGEA